MKKIIIYRQPSARFTGVAEAARELGVSKQAVSRYVSGVCRSSLAKDKAARIKIIDKE